MPSRLAGQLVSTRAGTATMATASTASLGRVRDTIADPLAPGITTLWRGQRLPGSGSINRLCCRELAAIAAVSNTSFSQVFDDRDWVSRRGWRTGSGAQKSVKERHGSGCCRLSAAAPAALG